MHPTRIQMFAWLLLLIAVSEVASQDMIGEIPWDQQPVVRFRRSPFQGVPISVGFVSDGGDDALSIVDYSVAARLAVPLGSFQNILVVTPGFRQHIIDAPADIDIPNHLYECSLGFFYRYPLTDRLTLLATVAPSIRSDFKTDDDGLRIFGLGLVVWEVIPNELKLSLGAVYLDRDDIPLLPAVGIDWSPRPDWTLELRFPRPRLLHRIAKNGPLSETWVYGAVGLGGNTFSVRRSDGQDDVLTLRDIQPVIGIEQIREGGRGYFAEAGLSVARSLEYESGDTRDFDTGLMLSAGWTF